MTTSRSFCPACNRWVDAFAPGPAGRPNARCPRCQALERHRMLLMMLRSHEYLFIPPTRVLDIAPTNAVRNYLLPLMGSRYVTTDLLMPSGIALRSDITKMCFEDGSFDVIICYHVLEHVPADGDAIAELRRILAPGGIAFIQVPRRKGVATDEDPTVPVEERVRRFGQDDHVRMYGDDFEERLAKGGLLATVMQPAAAVSADEVRRLGLQALEEVWVCRRSDGSDTSSPIAITWRPFVPTTAGSNRSLLARLKPYRTLPRRLARKVLR